MMTYIKLTEEEVNHILTLIDNNEQEGFYYGNKKQWEKRSERIKELLSDSIEPFDFKTE
jgi:hypothetical protein